MAKKTSDDGELKSFRNLASFRLHVLARLSERMHEQHYKREFGLSLRECRIIGITGGHGTPSFKRVYEESNLDIAHVSRLITGLIKRGLLRKENDPDDQRSVKVMLTERGRAVHRELHASATALNDSWLEPLSNADRAKLVAMFDVLTEHAKQLTDKELAKPRTRPAARAPRKRPAVTTNASGEVVLDSKMASQLLDVLNSALKKRG